ncbi:MAG: class I SAM-dependent methyltransferase [Candidatus Neomarinimicrobiota bacterium]
MRVTHPLPHETRMGKYYESDDYVPHSEVPRGIIPLLYGNVQRLTLVQKRNLVERMAHFSGRRLLDLGCGTGAFLNTMHRAGWEVDGVEAHERARELVRKRYGLQVQAPDQWLKSDSPGFDIVTLWHTLEHLHGLDRYLQRIRDGLRNDGFLFVAVPNYRSYDAEHYQTLWAAYDAPRHLYHFDFGSLATLFRKHRFRLFKIRHLPFDSFYVSMLSEKNGDGSLVRGVWIGLRSYLQALPDPRRSSSILFILNKGGGPAVGA